MQETWWRTSGCLANSNNNDSSSANDKDNDDGNEIIMTLNHSYLYYMCVGGCVYFFIHLLYKPECFIGISTTETNHITTRRKLQ